MAKQRDGSNTHNVLSMTVFANSGGGPSTGTSNFIYWHPRNGATTNWTSAFATGTTYMIEIIFNGTTSALYINGTFNTSLNNSAFNIINETSPTGWILGGWYQSNNYNNSGTTNYHLSGMAFFTTSLSTTDRESTEGIMAWRYGINSSLPTNHPYYNSAPSTGFSVTTSA